MSGTPPGRPFDEGADWSNALTLSERIAALRAARAEGAADAPAPEDPEEARLRLEEWSTQAPFSAAPLFARRLALDGIGSDELLQLLGESPETTQARSPKRPDWLEILARAFSRPAPAGPAPPAPPESEIPGEMLGFLNLSQPLVAQALERVRAGLAALGREHPEPPFDPAHVVDLLAADLPHQILMRVSRTLVLELNVARLEDVLEGDTPQERFQHFVERLREPQVAEALLREYPVLARQLVHCTENWVASSLEFLEHLCADAQAIAQTFVDGASIGRLVTLEVGAGDRHRGGRSVMVLGFDSGTRLVYKPRSLAVDRHFLELLAWINARGPELDFRTMRVLDRGDHGWAEFVEAVPCACADEVQRFYRRQGSTLALLYAVQATDFHYENLIACGEHPVLIDLESLFHPRLPGGDVGESEQLLHHAMGQSVLRVGLLPQRTWETDEGGGLDISGLASVEGELTPRGVAAWSQAATDEMHFARVRIPIPGTKNRPTRAGARIEVLDYTGDIVAGFTSLYRLLMREREALLASDGPLAAFADDEVRALLRPTRTYGMLLEDSFHPDHLRDALERDRSFDRLWIGVDVQPFFATAFEAEREELLRGDIPLFRTRPGSRDLWSGAERRLPDFLPQSGLDVVRSLVASLDEQDLERQVWFIEASLSTLASETDPSRWKTSCVESAGEPATPAALLAAARAVGDRLEALALRGGDGAGWIGQTRIDGQGWSLRPLGVDLYSGLPGVALFLGHLGALSDEPRYTRLARSAVASLCRDVERTRGKLESIGGFSGWGGILYGLAQLGALWGDAALLDEAERGVERVAQLVDADEGLDLIAGAAGAIGGLVALQRARPSERTLACIARCAEHLVARAQEAPQGTLAWSTPVPARQPLCGLSHGASGMALALVEAAAVTGEARYRETALAAMAYERTHLRRDVRNWPDLRQEAHGEDGSEHPMATWCHGAPGIALARLSALRHLDDRGLRADLELALETTLRRGFGLNHSLCHGDLGNLEPLALASVAGDDPRWGEAVERVAGSVLASIEERGWICGIPLGVESPGLMTGIAGIGYGLLRLVAPERVPCVLTLGS